jgi:uncharacterized membrane protein
VEDIVIATFQEPSLAREGMAELRRLHDTGELRVRAAAVLERRADETWLFDKEAAGLDFRGAAAGGLVGALLGTLTGPVGALLGGTPGLVSDELLDVAEDSTELILEVMVRHIQPGTTAILADIEEGADDALDTALATSGAQVKRWPRAEVVAELEGADEAAEAGRQEMRHIFHRNKEKAAQRG